MSIIKDMKELIECSCQDQPANEAAKPEVNYTIDDVTADAISNALEVGLIDHMTASAARRENKRALQKVADALNAALPPGARVKTPPSFKL